MWKKGLVIYNQLFALWVVLGGVLAWYFPQFFIQGKSLMDLFFGITMFGIGMVINPKDFIYIFRNVKTVLIGTASQYTIMPISAFFIAKIFHFSDEFTLGLILAGSAPGAMSSNVLSFLAKADVAYSVSLTTVSTLLAPILTPLMTLTLAHTILQIPFWNMMLSVIKMVLVPLFLGLTFNHFFYEKIKSLKEIFPAISTTFIAFICALVIALNKNYILQINLLIFAAVLILNLLGLFLGYSVGRVSKFDILKRRALSIEIGMQNAGLGSVLAIKHFSEKTALPAVIFVFVCIFTASFLVSYWAKRTDLNQIGEIH